MPEERLDLFFDVGHGVDAGLENALEGGSVRVVHHIEAQAQRVVEAERPGSNLRQRRRRRRRKGPLSCGNRRRLRRRLHLHQKFLLQPLHLSGRRCVRGPKKRNPGLLHLRALFLRARELAEAGVEPVGEDGENARAVASSAELVAPHPQNRPRRDDPVVLFRCVLRRKVGVGLDVALDVVPLEVGVESEGGPVSGIVHHLGDRPRDLDLRDEHRALGRLDLGADVVFAVARLLAATSMEERTRRSLARQAVGDLDAGGPREGDVLVAGGDAARGARQCQEFRLWNRDFLANLVDPGEPAAAKGCC